MPVACDSNERRRYMLRKDRRRGKEAVLKENLPRFFFRYLTSNQKKQYLKFGRSREDLLKLSDDEITKKRYEHLKQVLVGWENLKTPKGEPIEYDAENMEALGDALTDKEVSELYWSVEFELDEDDRDFFGSPQDSEQEKSADPESATAA